MPWIDELGDEVVWSEATIQLILQLMLKPVQKAIRMKVMHSLKFVDRVTLSIFKFIDILNIMRKEESDEVLWIVFSICIYKVTQLFRLNKILLAYNTLLNVRNLHQLQNENIIPFLLSWLEEAGVVLYMHKLSFKIFSELIKPFLDDRFAYLGPWHKPILHINVRHGVGVSFFEDTCSRNNAPHLLYQKDKDDYNHEAYLEFIRDEWYVLHFLSKLIYRKVSGVIVHLLVKWLLQYTLMIGLLFEIDTLLTLYHIDFLEVHVKVLVLNSHFVVKWGLLVLKLGTFTIYISILYFFGTLHLKFLSLILSFEHFIPVLV